MNMNRSLPEMPLLDRLKVQAEVLVPLVKRLEVELGADRAHHIVRTALSAEWRAHARRLASENGGSNGALMAHAADSSAGDAITMEWHELTDDFARMDVTECAAARFFRDLGEPELGHLLVCEIDDWFVEGLDDIEFERHHTIMEGAERCDFLYRRVAPKP
jgi:L-2-amino-thiazoline-4-carboxylic acid hydrolase